MNDRLTIDRRPASPVTTGASFEAELRELLTGRLKLVFGIGLGISVVTYAFEMGLMGGHELMLGEPLVPGNRFLPWHNAFMLAYILIFGGGTLLVFVREWTAFGLHVIDYAVFTLGLLLAAFAPAVFAPGVVPLYAVALMLLVHAAFVPVRTGYQAGLAATGALAHPAFLLLGYWLLPEFRAFWEAGPAVPLEASLGLSAAVLDSGFQLGVIAVVSVLITRTLYNMRRSLHQAQRLGSYTIEGELASGGMGQVYVARHALMCRPTAIKVVRTDSVEPKALARFEREVRLSSTLTHPNTITIFDFGRAQDNTFYYAMEYLEGLDLQQLVERHGPVPADRAVYIMQQACGSLQEAHGRGIVHRDIKPSNIFLTNRGGLHDFVKVLDFGLAKQVESDVAAELTKSGHLFGTPRYFAPETVHGVESLDARADVYNLGGVLYWMLTGRPPFVSTSPLEVIIDHVKTAPLPPSQATELEIPAELDAIVMRCLEKDPADRLQSARELARALRAVELTEPWTEERAEDWWELHQPLTNGAPQPCDEPPLTPSVGRPGATLRSSASS